MSFKRNDLQEYIEYEQGCFDLNQWKTYKPSLINWQISQSNISNIQRCVDSDIQSYYFKALQSIGQALDEIRKQKFAWSIVKLYYSTFYLLRCDILLSGFIMVRCGGLYYSEIKVGERLKLYQKNNLRGDHQYTIALANHLYDNGDFSDPILGNKIDGENAYLWLLKNRERVNYQMKDFSDPYPDRIISHIYSYFKEENLSRLLDFYASNTDYSVCFTKDHSVLSIPIKKLIDVHKKIMSNTNFDDVHSRKLASLNHLLRNLNISKSELNTIKTHANIL
ncbi:hypothetical protein [uncultured Draconibacterium sp.]|uniref:hypothetical protein n=1 Tax=uncultured Draconibacterium sp. TaxID=1573823 RepID=UPI003216F5FC